MLSSSWTLAAARDVLFLPIILRVPDQCVHKSYMPSSDRLADGLRQPNTVEYSCALLYIQQLVYVGTTCDDRVSHADLLQNGTAACPNGRVQVQKQTARPVLNRFRGAVVNIPLDCHKNDGRIPWRHQEQPSVSADSATLLFGVWLPYTGGAVRCNTHLATLRRLTHSTYCACGKRTGICFEMSSGHERNVSLTSPEYDSDASTSSRRSHRSRRQYASSPYSETHRRASSRSRASSILPPQNGFVILEDEEGFDHGHQYAEQAGSGVSASSLVHGIVRVFKNHRRAVVVLTLFLIATGSLHYISQPYVDVKQARHMLDDALKWGGQKVGLKGGFADSSQPPECHFRSTVEGKADHTVSEAYNR